MEFIQNNWYWGLTVLIPLIIKFGQEVAKQTETEKDDKFWAKAQAIYDAAKKVVLGVVNNKPKQEKKK